MEKASQNCTAFLFVLLVGRALGDPQSHFEKEPNLGPEDDFNSLDEKPELRNIDLVSDRIVKGWIADMHSIPWQTALLLCGRGCTTASPGCGGTIIDQYHILTAAHCVCSQGGYKNGTSFE